MKSLDFSLKSVRQIGGIPTAGARFALAIWSWRAVCLRQVQDLRKSRQVAAGRRRPVSDFELRHARSVHVERPAERPECWIDDIRDGTQKGCGALRVSGNQ